MGLTASFAVEYPTRRGWPYELVSPWFQNRPARPEGSAALEVRRDGCSSCRSTRLRSLTCRGEMRCRLGSERDGLPQPEVARGAPDGDLVPAGNQREAAASAVPLREGAH